MRLEPFASLLINGHTATRKQLEALEAVMEEGSQNRAAERMGISTPVLHRYLGQLEAKAGTWLVRSTPIGSVLTPEGQETVREYRAMRRRLATRELPVVGCSIITEDLLLSTLSRMSTDYDLIISDDGRNLRDFSSGLMDLVVVDDPLYVYDMDGVEWEEVGEDHLIHVDRGSRYIRFRYGAQRIGFRHLEVNGRPYTVERTVGHLPTLIRSNLSFFVNHSLLVRKGIGLRSDTPAKYLRHKILAVMADRGPDTSRLVRELRKEVLP
ncbi:MAG: LysR family transcriptional regulator [Methanomassiliicoccales archaeon]